MANENNLNDFSTICMYEVEPWPKSESMLYYLCTKVMSFEIIIYFWWGWNMTGESSTKNFKITKYTEVLYSDLNRLITSNPSDLDLIFFDSFDFFQSKRMN